MLKSRGCHNSRFPGDITHRHMHTQCRDVGKEEGGKEGGTRNLKLLGFTYMADHTRFLEAQEIFLTCREETRERRQRLRMLRGEYLQQNVCATCWPVGLGFFPAFQLEGDWMSIFGHVGAPLDGLCLITQCLVSAGWADG